MSNSSGQPALASLTAETKGSKASQRNRWWHWLVPRFSLRSLLICVTTVCLALGLWISRAERQRTACAQLKKLGWDWSFQEDTFSDDEPPKWLQAIPSLLRDGEAVHYWRTVEYVSAEGSHATEALELASQLPGLRQLVVRDCFEPWPADAWKKIARLTTLRDLNLAQTAIDDAGMAHVARLRNVTKLDLSNTVVGNEGARHLSRMPALEEMNLAETNIGDDGLAALARLPRLKVLNLGRTPVTGACLRHLADLESLTTLVLAGTRVDDRIAPAIGRMRQLETFDADDTELTDAAGVTMFTSPALTNISLRGTKIGSPTVAAVGKLPRIAMLDLSSTLLKPGNVALLNGSLSLENIWLPAEVSLDEIIAIRHLPALKYVHTGEEVLTPKHLAAIDGVCDGSTSLEFDLSHRRLGRKRWAKLAASRSVGVLRANHSDLDDEALANLSQIPGLHELSLEGCPITDEGLASLSTCYTLAKLDLSACPVTDAGLKHLSPLRSITVLSLRDCKGVTDAGLRHLAPIQVIDLDLSGTAVTDAGLKDFPAPGELVLDRTSVTIDGLFGLVPYPGLRRVRLASETFHRDELPFLVKQEVRQDADTLRLPKGIPFSRVHRKILSCGKSVTHLALTGQTLTEDDVKVLNHLAGLEQVTLTETPLIGAVCRWLGTRSLLTSLNIDDVPIQDEAVDALCSCPIAQLTLQNTRVSAEQLRKLTAIPTLASITLIRCPLSEEHLDILASVGEKLAELHLLETGLSAASMRRRLGHFANLEDLGWDGHPLPRGQMEWMIAMQKDAPKQVAAKKRIGRENSAARKAFGFCPFWYGPLRKERIARSRLVTDAMASRYLALGRDAQDVDLAGSEMGDATMRELAQFRWLISLDLSESTVLDKNFRCERDWSQLRTFIARDCQLGDEAIEQLADCWRLTSVDLDSTLISDRALATLGQMRFLDSLSLNGTKISDRGLPSLYGLRYLRYLHLGDTQITPEGIAELRRRLPQCQIECQAEYHIQWSSLIGAMRRP